MKLEPRKIKRFAQMMQLISGELGLKLKLLTPNFVFSSLFQTTVR